MGERKIPHDGKGVATICVVNYKTPLLTRLCLRSIRKFTRYPCEVIVVDNDSRDESLEYLRSLRWIRLLERPRQADSPGGGFEHGAALDLGLENCDTEFFVSLHSDAFVQREGWLEDLVGYFGRDDRTACVGSGKLELLPPWRVWLKQVTDLRSFQRKLLHRPDPLGVHRYYNRTICSLYRTALLKSEGLSFLMDREKGLTSGKKLYFELVDRGYRTVELSSSVMSRYIVHLAHATQASNPDQFKLRDRTFRKYQRFADMVLGSVMARSILADDSLER